MLVISDKGRTWPIIIIDTNNLYSFASTEYNASLIQFTLNQTQRFYDDWKLFN